jgi:hypothetical protein
MNLPDAPYPCPPGVVFRSGRKRGICPRCHKFIVSTSRIVRLRVWDLPHATPDRRRSADTGKLYWWDGRPIDLKPKWFVHERCFIKHYGQPALPPDADIPFATSLAAEVDAYYAALGDIAAHEEGSARDCSDIAALLTEMDHGDRQ